jgi:hypothetical protein
MFTWGWSGLWQDTSSHVMADYTTLHFHAFVFWTCTTVGGRDKLTLSPVLAHIGGRTMPIAWHNCSRDIFFLIVQMGHRHRDMLKDDCSTLEQFYMAFYRNTFETDSILYLDFCIVVSTKLNVMRQMITTTGWDRW